MMGGRAPKQKGSREERHIVALLQAAGIAAERIPLSGAAGGKFAGDISLPLAGMDRIAEVKVRAHGFGTLYRWLAKADLLIVRSDRSVPLVVLPWPLAIALARIVEAKKNGGDNGAA
jgi:hypothetical protein